MHKWVCDHCKTAVFDSYEETVEHEKICPDNVDNECADGVTIPANNGKFKNSKSTNLTYHSCNISEITDKNVYETYLNDGSDLMVYLKHTRM